MQSSSSRRYALKSVACVCAPYARQAGRRGAASLEIHDLTKRDVCDVLQHEVSPRPSTPSLRVANASLTRLRGFRSASARLHVRGDESSSPRRPSRRVRVGGSAGGPEARNEVLLDPMERGGTGSGHGVRVQEAQGTKQISFCSPPVRHLQPFPSHRIPNLSLCHYARVSNHGQSTRRPCHCHALAPTKACSRPCDPPSSAAALRLCESDPRMASFGLTWSLQMMSPSSSTRCATRFPSFARRAGFAKLTTM